MEMVEKYCNEIHLTLKKLMEQKSKRDRFNFTIYQLSKALNMPHSILVRLIHSDPEKRVNNPRIDTLTKIVKFFKDDGFNITIDDFLFGYKGKSVVDVQAQKVNNFLTEKQVPIYSFQAFNLEKVGKIDIKIASKSKNIVALLSDEEIKPIFKKGSIFIVDKDMEPEDDTLVAAQVEGYKKILIRKFYEESNKKLLKSCEHGILPIVLMPTMSYSIIGVVIQVNAKT